MKPISLGIGSIAIYDCPGWATSYSEDDEGGGGGVDWQTRQTSRIGLGQLRKQSNTPQPAVQSAATKWRCRWNLYTKEVGHANQARRAALSPAFDDL
jgi:hypothetical protein